MYNSIKIKRQWWYSRVYNRIWKLIRFYSIALNYLSPYACIFICNITKHFSLFSLAFSFQQLFQAHIIYYHEYKSWKMQINTLDNRFEYIPSNPHRKQCQKYRAYGVELSFFFCFASLTVYIKLVFILH